MMNCKQGDLAVIVRSRAGNEGKIVVCLKLLPYTGDGQLQFRGPRWRVNRILPGVFGPMNEVADYALRPLRDGDGEDEMLRLVGLPAGAPQAA